MYLYFYRAVVSANLFHWLTRTFICHFHSSYMFYIVLINDDDDDDDDIFAKVFGPCNRVPSLVVLIQYQIMTEDGRTDGHTNGRTDVRSTLKLCHHAVRMTEMNNLLVVGFHWSLFSVVL